MANEKETGLEILVSAEADVKSAEAAAEKIEKGVLSKLKDGYIPIPVEIKTPIRGASKELKQAQEDVINQWEKTFSKGFSSSKKDLDDLSAAYRKFKKLGSSKAGTKQYKYISSLMGEQVQNYDKNKAASKDKLDRIQTAVAKKRNQKRTTRKFDNDLPSTEEIEANIKSYNKRKLSGLRDVTRPLGFKSYSGINPGGTNDDAVKDSEFSPYRNSWMTQQKLSEIKAKQDLKKYNKSWIDKNYAEKNGLADRNKTTEKDQINALNKKAFNQLADLVSKALKGGIEDVFKELSDQVKVVTILSQKSR